MEIVTPINRCYIDKFEFEFGDVSYCPEAEEYILELGTGDIYHLNAGVCYNEKARTTVTRTLLFTIDESVTRGTIIVKDIICSFT